MELEIVKEALGTGLFILVSFVFGYLTLKICFWMDSGTKKNGADIRIPIEVEK